MDSPLSVLLRDGTHAGATTRLALKAEQFSVSYGRTPLVTALAGSHPILLDLGINRPNVTISGIIDNIGGDSTNTTSGFEDMEAMTISGQVYYIPYKNFLEGKLATWRVGTSIFVEVGDATTPIHSGGTDATGGGIYEVATQQFQFSLAPGMEDRWMYSISFASKLRSDISF